MSFEWKHTRDDHLAVLEYQILHLSMSPFGVSARRRARFFIFLMFFVPITILFILNFNQQSLVSTVTVFGIAVMLFWMLVIKKQKKETIESGAIKLAKRYLKSANTLPTGMHQLTTDGLVLDWHWIDGDERSSHPISKIEEIRESDGRLYFIRKGEAADSIPFHAFGDQETRMAFVGMIKNSIKKESDV